jgi:hypothetical protein
VNDQAKEIVLVGGEIGFPKLPILLKQLWLRDLHLRSMKLSTGIYSVTKEKTLRKRNIQN